MPLIKGNSYQKNPPVILLEGGVVSLSVARSLGNLGIRVYACDIVGNHARFSRHSQKVFFNGANPLDWMTWLTDKALSHYRGAVIFPCSDNTMEMIARHRAELERNYILPEANDKILLAMLDKAKTYPLAEKLLIPVPKTWIVQKRDDIEKIMKSVPYPCALKPRYSHDFRGRQFFKKFFIVRDHHELVDLFDYLHQIGTRDQFRSDLILTEIIPGEEEDQFQSYYCYLDESGTPLFHFTKRKLRQYPNDSGNGCYHMTDRNPEVAALGLKFFQGVGYLGLGAIEFKRDPRDGLLKMMECNARLTTATELLQQSGFDICQFIYNRLTGKPLPEMTKYRRGVRLIRPLHDFLSFRNAHRRGLLTWGRWLRSILHRQHFEVFSFRDPLPWLMITLYYVKRLWTKLTADR